MLQQNLFIFSQLKFLIPSKASAETSPHPAFHISSGNTVFTSLI
jgi:hypothetical protein